MSHGTVRFAGLETFFHNCLFDFRDKDDDAGQNKTVKPTATMKLYKDGADISGGSVKLTDIVTMILQLDDEYIGKSALKAYNYVHKGSLVD